MTKLTNFLNIVFFINWCYHSFHLPLNSSVKMTWKMLNLAKNRSSLFKCDHKLSLSIYIYTYSNDIEHVTEHIQVFFLCNIIQHVLVIYLMCWVFIYYLLGLAAFCVPKLLNCVPTKLRNRSWCSSFALKTRLLRQCMSSSSITEA